MPPVRGRVGTGPAIYERVPPSPAKRVCIAFVVTALTVVKFEGVADAQLAVDSAAQLLAQNAQIEQGRLFARPVGTEGTGMTADGTPLPGSEGGNSGDDSFGAQQILKTEPPKAPEFSFSGDSTLFYTTNVALTKRNEIDDGISVTNAAFSWNHAISPELQFQVGGHVALFRYLNTSSLDFENLGAGLGLAWAPRNPWGISFFGRYDFSELLDKHSRELLEDHEFSAGLQKVWVFNRRSAFTAGILGSVGISDPFAAQRDQIAGFAGYHLALTQHLDTELTYRLSGFFYNQGGRDDLNQALTFALRYHLTQWMDAGALLSLGFNHSSQEVFDYQVLNTGGVASLTIHF